MSCLYIFASDDITIGWYTGIDSGWQWHQLAWASGGIGFGWHWHWVALALGGIGIGRHLHWVPLASGGIDIWWHRHWYWVALALDGIDIMVFILVITMVNIIFITSVQTRELYSSIICTNKEWKTQVTTKGYSGA